MVIEGSLGILGGSDLSHSTIFPNVSMRVFHGAGTNDEEKTLPSSGGYISVYLVS
jgi:hypothetical protein